MAREDAEQFLVACFKGEIKEREAEFVRMKNIGFMNQTQLQFLEKRIEETKRLADLQKVYRYSGSSFLT
ncbi:MAG: hypothetical protein WBC04_21640 [Candidatus Acidiferrales bacterium]